MANVLLELQRQRDALLSTIDATNKTIESLLTQLASIDALLADMTRDDASAMTYGALLVDGTGVTVIPAKDVVASDVTAVTAAVAKPKPLV